MASDGKKEQDLTDLVPLAFSAGWNISELYFSKLPQKVKLLDAVELPPRLPELSTMPAWQRAQVTALRLAADIGRLGLPDNLPASLNFDALATKEAADASFRSQVYALHLAVFNALAARDARVLLSYRLGVALAMTVLSVRGKTPSPYSEELKAPRVGTIQQWLDGLRTLLPSHSADAVKYTLREWSSWAGKRKPGTPNDARSTGSLRRQGEQWRSLLSGEKPAADMLEVEDYARAASRMVKRIGGLVIRSTFSWLGLVTLLILLLLVGAALWILSTGVNLTKIVAVLLALGTPIGLTASSVRTAVKRSLAAAQAPIWSALLVEAIGEATYINPIGHTPAHVSLWRRAWLRVFPPPAQDDAESDPAAATTIDTVAT